MIHVPGMKNGGRRADGLVEFVDIYPTVCDACGVEPPGDLEGVSLLPLMDDPGRAWKSAAFSQFTRPYLTDQDWEQMGYTVRTKRHRYTEWVDREREVVARELYDYEIAAVETVNLADRPEHAVLLTRMSDILHAGWRAALPSEA